MTRVGFSVTDGVGEVAIDDPPLNLFGLELINGLNDAAE
jgi:hypothetical protein